MVMVTSIALLGNAVQTLQAADVITYRRTSGPRLPIFLAEATGIWPTVWSLLAQVAPRQPCTCSARSTSSSCAPAWPTARRAASAPHERHVARISRR